MPPLTRPPKAQYGTTSYVGEVVAATPADVPILAVDVDGDLDPLYAAHNALQTQVNAIPPPPTVFPVFIGPSAPTAPVVGQLWWRTTDGNLYVYYNDGVTAQFVPAMASVGKLTAGQYYLLAGAVSGSPPASVSLGYYVAALGFTLPLNLAGSQAVAKTAATAQTDVAILVNGVSKGSIRWAAAATVASFVFSAAVTVLTGDRIELVAPATADATLADFTWTLRGTI
jgi:hypothetical protein